MSALPEDELDLDKLFLPAWAQVPASAKHYAGFEANEADTRERRGERHDRRPPRREGGPRDRPMGARPRGDRPGRPGGQFQRKGPGPFSKEGFGAPRGEPRERREPPPPLPDINVLFFPDEKGVESLARQIRTTGRAYPLFDIARLVLQKQERYSTTFRVIKKPDGQVSQPLFVCALDDTLWLSENEAVEHALRTHFGTFYQTERTATEPPKGKYTFVAQCGMSGIILGPPNYHDYQNQLHKLHTERFSRMPFEAFKARVKIVRDEEVVKKWIDDQSWKTEYVCLNMPEPLRLPNRDAVEKHFREVHKENIIKTTETHTLNGAAARAPSSRELARLVRQVWEDQKRFPLQIATTLSQQFAGHGLQFFKVNRAITHVSVARPHYLDLETTPVSDGVRRIVEFINSCPKCTRRKLVEALAPTPIPAISTNGPAAAASPQEGIAKTIEGGASQEPVPAPTRVEASEPTSEQTAIVSDLHWLIHEGHVIEFANGILETAKKPLPKPPKPERRLPAGRPEETGPAAESAAAQENEPAIAANKELAADKAAAEPGHPRMEPLPPEDITPSVPAIETETSVDTPPTPA